MENLYDFNRHTTYALVFIGNQYADIRFHESSSRDPYINDAKESIYRKNARIIYDNEKKKVRCFGDGCSDCTSVNSDGVSHTLENDDILVDNFLDKLHLVSRKNKNTWNEDDKFTIKAVSDFLNLLLKKKKEEIYDARHLNYDSFHYAIVVPSEWEEETRDDLIGTIFTQAKLTSKDDHRDRIIISSDIECFFMYLINERFWQPMRGQNILMFRHIRIHQEAVLIKLYLISMSNTRFDFVNSKLYPTVKYSTSFSITVDYIKNCIKDFLKDNLFLINENNYHIIETLVDEIYNSLNNSCYGKNEIEDFETPVFINTDRWNLNNSQKTFLSSIRLSDLCIIVGKPLFDNIKCKILSSSAKKYDHISANDDYKSYVELDPILSIWLKYILKWNTQLLNEKKNIIKIKLDAGLIGMYSLGNGLCRIVTETIQNSCIYGRPQINSVNYSNESLFFNLRPDIIINIDISFHCTLLKCTLFNDDTLTQNVFDHNYLTAEKSLPSLQTFYNVSNVPSLTIDKSFIPFADKHLRRIADKHFFDVLKKLFFRKTNFLYKVEVMLNKAQSTKNNSITTTQQKKYIKAFLLMYLIYIKEILSSRLSAHINLESTDMKVGFAISVEKILLDIIVGTKDDLRELVYTSGLVKKDDAFKKLRISTQGEGVLSSIKQLLEIHFPLKSYFILAQIHEDYIQLTLDQVVTTSNSKNEQEAIIIKDKILYIQNVYDSLCLYIWNSLIQNLSLIQLCNNHHKTDHGELFTIKVKKEITDQLKQYILINILTENSNCQTFHKSAFKLHLSCGCKISMTTHDIIDIAFRPFLKYINSTISSALINKNIFGLYKNIEYHFNLICFNYNVHFQKILTDILEEESRHFNPIRGIDTVFKTIPASKVRSFSLKEFQIGTLHQVYNGNYVFSISESYGEVYDEAYDKKSGLKELNCYFKEKITDKQTFPGDENVGYHFLTAGDILSRNKVFKTAYIYSPVDYRTTVGIDIYRCGTFDATNDRAFLRKNKTWEMLAFISLYIYPGKTLYVNITAEHIEYSSSIKFSISDVYGERTSRIAEVGVPMTLSYF